MSPIFFSCPGVLSHDAIVNCSPRRQDITFEYIFGAKRNSFQELFLRGNRELKIVRNFLFCAVNCFSINDLDATSVILLFSPWMLTVNIGEVWCTCRRAARDFSRCPATTDDVLFNLFAHDTEELSQCMPTVVCLRWIGEVCSSTSQPSSSPVTSKPLIVRVPCGFSSDMIFLVISSGHSSLQTIGWCRDFVPSVHTPPTPVLHA